MYMRWIGIWLKAAADRFVHDHPSAETLEFRGKRKAEILRDIEMERLRRGLEPLLSEAQWYGLISRGHSPELSRERFDELKAIGVLAEGDVDRLSIKPVWLANALQLVAIEHLYSDPPNGLGSLLLYKNTSENVLRRLIHEVCAGNFRCIEACLKAGEPSTPEHMVALDGVFRAIGFALLNGVSLPVEWARKIWVWQMRHRVQRYTNWPPIPILQVAEQNHDGATTTSVWLAAAFSISRALTNAGATVGSSALNPWRGFPEYARERDTCIEALSSIDRVSRSDKVNAELDFLNLSIYRLGAALFEKFGILRRHGGLLDLQGPDLLVALASGKEHEIPESDWSSVLYLSFGLKALEEACMRRNVDFDDVLRWCWRKWGTQADMWRWPPLRWVSREEIGTKYEDAERLWKVVPVDALPDVFYKQLENIPSIWPWFTDAIWAHWLDVWSTRNGRWHEGVNVFNALPQALALQAVRDGRVDGHCHNVREILWQRVPGALLDLVDELASSQPSPRVPDGGGPISWLVYAAPAEHCPRLVERARTWHSTPSAYPGVTGWVGRWLAYVVKQRSPGWREAYELLVSNGT